MKPSGFWTGVALALACLGLASLTLEIVQRRRCALAEADLEAGLREFEATARGVLDYKPELLRRAKDTDIGATSFRVEELPLCAGPLPMRAWTVVPASEALRADSALFTAQVNIVQIRRLLLLRPRVDVHVASHLDPMILEPLVARLRAHGQEVEMRYFEK
jgi:hypothetical protein